MKLNHTEKRHSVSLPVYEQYHDFIGNIPKFVQSMGDHPFLNLLIEIMVEKQTIQIPKENMPERFLEDQNVAIEIGPIEKMVISPEEVLLMREYYLNIGLDNYISDGEIAPKQFQPREMYERFTNQDY